MNKKIYFNDNYIEFTDNKLQVSQNQPIKFYELSAKPGQILIKILEDFIAGAGSVKIYMGQNTFGSVLDLWKDQLHYIEAAGGFIQKKDQYLFIHRHGRWDLPKGKLEKKETVEHAAVRECEEECSIKKLVILSQLSSTYHIYPYKKSFALKQSYWFHMESDYDKKLIPQLEESIDEVRWFTREEIKSTVLVDTYYTIQDVVNEALSSR